MKDLKQRTIRSGFAKLCGQAVSFLLRLSYLVIMARLLDPKDFGLVAMVAAVTGVYELLTSAGLSTVTIQERDISGEQISALFWINILVGSILAILCLLTAPIIVRFYDEPRLFWITVFTAGGFIINAAGVQHFALLQRQLRFVALTTIEVISQVASLIIGIVMAGTGLGYWALVGATLVAPAIGTMSVWLITSWIPRHPFRRAEIGSMLQFGGTVTLNGIIVYIAYNFDKILLGRYWGPDALGLYGRAYTLINVPTSNLNSAIGIVAFSALSRLQDDHLRFKRYFLRVYSLVNSVTIPTTLFCALFADEIILLVLGPKWAGAAPIFRLLTPTVLVFGMINPLAWLLLSLRLQGRSLRIALVIAPLTIAAYMIGLPYGPGGVAVAYSAAMTIWLGPHVVWCVHRTPVSPRDLFWAIIRPLGAAVIAGAVAFVIRIHLFETHQLVKFALAAGVMIATYLATFLVVMGQCVLYLDLFRGLRSPSRVVIEEPKGACTL